MEKKTNEDLEYIKKFSSISVTDVCKKLGVDRSNLLNARTTQKKMKLVRKGLESEIAKLYLMEEKENDKKQACTSLGNYFICAYDTRFCIVRRR